MKYRKKPIAIEATQWFKNGDHPEDKSELLTHSETGGKFLSEGEVVRRYNHPAVNGASFCDKCIKQMNDHGWIDPPGGSSCLGGYKACPGDFIITGAGGEYYPCKPDIFELTYEKVGENEQRK